MTRRRAQGEGSAYYDDDRAKWVGQFSAGINPATGRRRRFKVSADTKAEAPRLLRERIEGERSVEIRTVGDWLTIGCKVGAAAEVS